MRNSHVLAAAGTLCLAATFAAADGDVIVEEKGRNVLITGDGGDNSLTLNPTNQPGEFRVAGTGGTTINGGADPVVMPTPRGRLLIRMGDGDDTIDGLGDDNAPLALGDVDADFGAGSNRLDLASYYPGKPGVLVDDLRVRPGPDGNVLDFYFVEIAGRMNVDLGPGSNGITTEALSVGKSAKIAGGDDFDFFTLRGAQFAGPLKVSLGAGNDILNMPLARCSKSVKIAAGAGQNVLGPSDATFDGPVKISVAGGSIQLRSIGDTFAKKVTVRSSDAADEVRFVDAQLAGKVSIDTRGGADTIFFQNGTEAQGPLRVNAGDGADGIDLTNSLFGSKLSLLGGPGDDIIVLDGNTLDGKVLINGGPGNDALLGPIADFNTVNGPDPKLKEFEAIGDLDR